MNDADWNYEKRERNRRIGAWLWGILLGALLVSPGVHCDSTLLPEPAPHRYTEWSSNDVSGMVLIDPTRVDSLGLHPTYVLPKGSILAIPHIREGFPDPATQMDMI